MGSVDPTPRFEPLRTEALERLVERYEAQGNAAKSDRRREGLASRQAAEKTPKQ